MPDNKHKFPPIVKLLNDKYNELTDDGHLSKEDKAALKAIAESNPEISKFSTHPFFDHMIFVHTDAGGKERRYVNEEKGLTIFKPLTPIYGWVGEEFIKRQFTPSPLSDLKEELLNMLPDLQKSNVAPGSPTKNLNNTRNLPTQSSPYKN